MFACASTVRRVRHTRCRQPGLGHAQHAGLGWARACWEGYLYRKSAFTLPDPTRLTTSLSTLTFSSCPSNIILLRVRGFLHDSYICNVVDEGLLAGPPPGQGGYYPQPPQQAYQGGGQPGYQPQPQPQVVYV